MDIPVSGSTATHVRITVDRHPMPDYIKRDEDMYKGYQLTWYPVEITVRDGYQITKSSAYSGYRKKLAECTRFGGKLENTLDKLIDIPECMESLGYKLEGDNWVYSD